MVDLKRREIWTNQKLEFKAAFMDFPRFAKLPRKKVKSTPHFSRELHVRATRCRLLRKDTQTFRASLLRWAMMCPTISCCTTQRDASWDLLRDQRGPSRVFSNHEALFAPLPASQSALRQKRSCLSRPGLSPPRLSYLT